MFAADPERFTNRPWFRAQEGKPPLRFAAGAFALKTIDTKLADMRAELDHWRQLSAGTDHAV